MRWVARPGAFVARAGPMAKRIHPSSWSQEPEKVQAPGRRGRASRGRTSFRAAMTEPGGGRGSPRGRFGGLPEQDTSGFTVLDFLYAAGSPVDALLYSRLFWPELLEVEGAVLLATASRTRPISRGCARACASAGRSRPSGASTCGSSRICSATGSREIERRPGGDSAGAAREMWRGRLQDGFPSVASQSRCCQRKKPAATSASCFHQRREPHHLSAGASGRRGRRGR